MLIYILFADVLKEVSRVILFAVVLLVYRFIYISISIYCWGILILIFILKHIVKTCILITFAFCIVFRVQHETRYGLGRRHSTTENERSWKNNASRWVVFHITCFFAPVMKRPHALSVAPARVSFCDSPPTPLVGTW